MLGSTGMLGKCRRTCLKRPGPCTVLRVPAAACRIAASYCSKACVKFSHVYLMESTAESTEYCYDVCCCRAPRVGASFEAHLTSLEQDLQKQQVRAAGLLAEGVYVCMVSCCAALLWLPACLVPCRVCRGCMRRFWFGCGRRSEVLLCHCSILQAEGYTQG